MNKLILFLILGLFVSGCVGAAPKYQSGDVLSNRSGGVPLRIVMDNRGGNYELVCIPVYGDAGCRPEILPISHIDEAKEGYGDYYTKVGHLNLDEYVKDSKNASSLMELATCWDKNYVPYG